jgi:hypothetical protein
VNDDIPRDTGGKRGLRSARRRWLAAAAVILGLLLFHELFVSSIFPDERDLPRAMVDRWEGATLVRSAATDSTTLPLVLSLAASGMVNGRFGGARIVEGRIRTDRGLLQRWFGSNTDYSVTVQLEGDVVPGERVRRTELYLNIHYENDTLRCLGQTSGGPATGIEDQRIAVVDGALVRTRPDDEHTGSPR